MVEVEIANLALGRIGEKQTLTTLTDNETGRRCALLYPNVRDRAIEDGRPRWAERIVALALSVETIPGWRYVYQYPGDCLSLSRICDESGARLWARSDGRFPAHTTLPAEPFRVFAGDESTLIATDAPNAYAVYVARVSNPARYPATFTSGLAWLLASELALAMKVDADLAEHALQMTARDFSTAAAMSFNESGEDATPPSPSIQARG